VTAAAGVETVESLEVEPSEREPLLAEIDRFVGSLDPHSAAAGRYARLRAAVAEPSPEPSPEPSRLPGDLVETLQGLLEIALSSRSVRHFHGPGAERALAALYARTPRGAAVERAARDANRALETVAGQRVERLSFRPGLPGEHRLVVETERCRITFEIGPDGVSAREVSL
jgi:hypothetical protein